MHHLILFASGKGSNVAVIHEYFKAANRADIALIVCNNAGAGVVSFAAQEHIPYLIVDKQTFHEALFVEQLREYAPSMLVLAGFLWKIPSAVVQAFPGKIINIHPALLPLYGGKGMYGHHVHNAVLTAGDAQSGITIHEVNEVYDEGKIIIQAYCKILKTDTPETLAARVHQLEHFYFPRTIEFLLDNI